MKILFFGDIVGQAGRQAVKNTIDGLVKKYQIDFVIANGENATHGKGLIEKHYNELIDAGIDCITLGNRYLSKNNILSYIDDATCLIRPLNLIRDIGGVGSEVYEVNGILVRVTNLLGTAFMKEEVNNPYYSLKTLIDEIEGENSIHIVDFHAEATGEKMCMGYCFDGLVSAVVGTHTHVQTNDAKILENGTGFISDVGMTGLYDSALGFEKNSVVKKIIYGEQSKFDIPEDGKGVFSAVVLDVDPISGKTTEIFPIYFIEK